jgi:hypothetical protein
VQPPDPIDCNGLWNADEGCPVPCGGGVQQWSHSVTQVPLYGGADCPETPGEHGICGITPRRTQILTPWLLLCSHTRLQHGQVLRRCGVPAMRGHRPPSPVPAARVPRRVHDGKGGRRHGAAAVPRRKRAAGAGGDSAAAAALVWFGYAFRLRLPFPMLGAKYMGLTVYNIMGSISRLYLCYTAVPRGVYGA